MKDFKKFDISMLVENSIKETDLAISVSEISDKIQKMIQDLSDMKIVDIAELVKQIKYDNRIEQAEQLEQQMGSKLDQAIETLTAVKSEIDNDVVKLFNGEGLEDDAPMADDGADLDTALADDGADADLDTGMEMGDEESVEDDLADFEPDERTLKDELGDL